MAQQSSRLQRLLTLLDTGSTQTTRFTAARQIGEIAKLHPQDLSALLKKVSQYLRSKNWDTRVAAAQAIGAIAENVKHISINEIRDNAESELLKLGINQNVKDLMVAGWNLVPISTTLLSFGSFDINKVLEFGGPLLASGGQEYDIAIDNSKNSAERLARQKENLSRRLGLDVCEDYMDVNDMIRDEDLIVHKVSAHGNGAQHKYCAVQSGTQHIQKLVTNMVPGYFPRKLSARERNLLKRKAKVNVNHSKGWCDDDDTEEPVPKNKVTIKPVSMEQSPKSNKVLMETMVEEESLDQPSDGKWPFIYFVEQLIHDMFDPIWEIRHGSIMALREILSYQAASAGVSLPDLNSKGAWCSEMEENKMNHSLKREREIDFDLNVGLNLEEYASEAKKIKIENISGEIVGENEAEELNLGMPLKHENGTWNFSSSDNHAALSLGFAKPELDLNADVLPPPVLDKEEEISVHKHKSPCMDFDILPKLPEDSTALKMLRVAKHESAKNWEFLQDCAIRFLCVLSLDRFGDYVSDQVVAPVRETCAQALGAVLKHMHPSLVYETLSILLQMQNRQEWEIRHGSLLGIKYLVAVRQDMLQELLFRILPAINFGLEDRDDDVRAVAAEALTPAASAVVSFSGQMVNTILMKLWDILLDLDDLSPSTSSVMHLLAELYSQPEVVPRTLGAIQPVQKQMFDLNEAIELDDNVDGTKTDDNPYLLSSLAPRLWPFMRHSISSVRHAAIRTLERLLEAGSRGNSLTGRIDSFWPIPILGNALRIVFQNLLLESNEPIIQCSEQVWRLLLQCPQEELALAANCYFASWLKISTTPCGSPLDASKMFSPMSLPRKSQFKAAAKLRAAKGECLNLGNLTCAEKQVPINDKSFDLSSNFVKIYVGSDGEQSVTCMRVLTGSALGVLVANLPETLFPKVVDSLLEHLTSLSAVQRQVASIVLVSWFKELRGCIPKEGMDSAIDAVKTLRQRLLDLLGCTDPAVPTRDSSLPYAELSRTYGKMRVEVASLIRIADASGCFQNVFSTGIPPADELGIDAVIDLGTKLSVSKDALSGDGKEKQTLESLEAARQRVLATAGYLKSVQCNLHVSVSALMSGAVVWMVELPVRLNPVIQPLMAALKREQEEVLQKMAAEALAEIISQCVGRKPGPNDKLIKNLCALTCTDPNETPQATQMNANELIIEDKESILPGRGTSSQRSKSQIVSVGEERSKMEGFISRRGAELALKSLCDKFGSSLFEMLPRLWDCLTEVLKPNVPDGQELLKAILNAQIVEFNEDPQALINNLQVVRSIVPLLVQPLQLKLLTLLPGIFGCVRHCHIAVRLAASRCITSMAKTLTVHVMAAVMEKAIPMFRDSSSVQARQGAGMLVTSLVEELGVKLVAYAPLLVVPLLGCMSDSDPTVRQSVTRSFAALVPLLPLARGVPPPTGLSENLSSRTAEDAHFLEQLLDNSQVDDYKLALELKVTLRRYQQEGINWLAFLKRFKLHGILCDDMGLGKTLQASAIVASDTVERLSFKGEKDQLRSLIVCPSTLVGHWAFEIEKFIDNSILNPLQYVGSPQERSMLRNQFGKFNIILTSYDVIRKDVDFLGHIVWNYCILDEGHIIKNAKSKVTTAVKQLKAEHRLILSGTPIQNNVLELWSLFDFLMPGFLGTERQFQSTYGKPLLAARDAKCSAKDAEAGALAMEALHKQVMPFLLRRTKDEVLADLPEKIIQDRYCDLSPVQLKLYEQFSHSETKKEISTLVETCSSSDPKDEVATSTSKASSHVFQALQYLLKLCSHPLLAIGDMSPDSIASHLSECVHDSKDIKSSLHDLHHAPKLVALQEILEECGIGIAGSGSESIAVAEGSQHRVLIFAQHKAFLDIIEKDLFQTHMKSVTYLRLDGSVEPSRRFDIVKAFNSDPTIDVLLLTTHVGGLGLNLTSADTVVFVEHDWNPMRDHQAMDRAHRLGQRKVVNVHRLIMRGTLEEKIMGLQKFKVSVANAVINAENASLNSMDTTQLLDLFTPSATSGKIASSLKRLEGYEVSSNANAIGEAKGLKTMLNSLEELWDQSQYTEEYNVGQFVARLSS